MATAPVRPLVPRAAAAPPSGGPSSWVAACVSAEAVGMTAASAAAVAADRLPPLPGLALVVAGGVVEGSALGWFQGRVLAGRLPTLSRLRYGAATVLVAGVGWAAASAPAALGPAGGTAPPLLAVLALAAGLGLVMGLLLGAAQAVAVRGDLARPWRWALATGAGWTAAMPVVFAGATLPNAGWPPAAIVATGLVTGILAGAVLGLASAWAVPAPDGSSATTRVVLRLLRSRRSASLRRSLIGLEVAGRRTGRRYRLPVQFAETPEGLAVVPGHAERKTWWRNIAATDTALRVLRDGGWTDAVARRLSPGDPEYAAARAAYEQRWPHHRLPPQQPVVLVRTTRSRTSPHR